MRKVHFSKQTGTAALFQNYTACLREKSSRTLETRNFAEVTCKDCKKYQIYVWNPATEQYELRTNSE